MQMRRVITAAADDAIKRGSGPLYDAMLAAAAKFNEELTSAELRRGLAEFRGPVSAIDIFTDRQTIVTMPDGVKVAGQPVDVFEMDPGFVIACQITLGALYAAIRSTMGGVDGYLALKQAYVAEGGKENDFDEAILTRFRKERADAIREAWDRAKKPSKPREPSGCLSEVAIVVGVSIALIALAAFTNLR